ncbi:MAG: hypothetical protein ACOYJJ_03015 [Anaerovoracaceae bacterium]|jgi:hypothetical protein
MNQIKSNVRTDRKENIMMYALIGIIALAASLGFMEIVNRAAAR